MSTSLCTIAVLRAKPGKAEALIPLLEKLAAETRTYQAGLWTKQV